MSGRMETFAGIFLSMLCYAVIAFTLGQIGHSTEETPNFVTQVHQVSVCPNKPRYGLPLPRSARSKILPLLLT